MVLSPRTIATAGWLCAPLAVASDGYLCPSRARDGGDALVLPPVRAHRLAAQITREDEELLLVATSLYRWLLH